MHSLRRSLLLAAIFAALASAGHVLLGSVSLVTRQETVASLDTAIGQAGDNYQQRAGLEEEHAKLKAAFDKEEAAMRAVGQKKRELRLTIASLRRTLTLLEARTGSAIPSVDAARLLVAARRQEVEDLLQKAQTAAVQQQPPVTGWRAWVEFLLSLGMTREHARLATPVVKLDPKLLSDIADFTFAATVQQHFAQLTAQYATLQQQKAPVEESDRAAALALEHSDARLQQILLVTAQVHDEVFSLQGHLQRIDAQLKHTVVETQSGTTLHSAALPQNPGDRPTFVWPAHGWLSAGFHDGHYQQFFGVPHEGQDIVVSQGTPVASAADGVVFVVHEGGLTGYTYVLIGHRNGYATLYGHLSQVSVATGQHVTAGQIIGRSGGQPGTPGSGPMTTAPHLHFEVIKDGVNIDPKTVLP